MRPRFRYRALRIGIDHDRLQGIPVDPVGDQPVGGLLPEVRSIKEFPRCALVVAPDPFDSAPVRVDTGRGIKIVLAGNSPQGAKAVPAIRSEEHTSELQSLMRISYAVFCLKKKNNHTDTQHNQST